MQFKTTLFNVFLATLTMSASAQHNCDVGDLGAIIFKKTNCESDDIKCVCSKTELLPELRAELTKRCSPEDGEKLVAFAIEECRDAGVVIHVPVGVEH